MNRNHLGRWIVAGASALVLTGAGTAAASTAPVDSTPAAAESGGPSNCPTIPAAAASAGSGPDASAAPGGSSAPMEAASSAPGAESSDSAAMAAGAFVQVAESEEFGPILVDANCLTLYIFTNDTPGTSACVEGCAEAWPPLTVPDGVVPPLADELDASLFSVIEHSEAGPMLQVGDWPLYYFASDAAPGDINGQAVGGVWWVVAPDGTMIEAGATDAGAAGSEPMGTEAMGTESMGSGDGY